MSSHAATTWQNDSAAVRLDASHALVWEARATAAILDLVQKTSRADDRASACRIQANALQQFLGCGPLAVGLRRQGRGRCRLMAVSGLTDVDSHSPAAREMETAMDSAVLRAEHEPEAAVNESHDEAPRCIPLHTPDGCVVGAWYCADLDHAENSESNLRFLGAAAAAVAETLKLLEEARGGIVRSALRRIAKSLSRVRRGAIALAVAAALAALCIPVPYDVGAQCELQPDVRRFIAAPHAGEFQKSLVKPGDVVAAGQVLARMEGREVRWELATVVAEQERARKSRDVNMAQGKTAAAQIDALEVRRQQVKQKLLERRLANLDIKSPIAGVVVAGDLQRSEGATVTEGQVLYEVAPLGRMTAELAISDEEIGHVTEGMRAALRLESQPQQSWRGAIDRIHPRAVTREKDNVFIAEVALDNPQGTLRPGMKGRAEIGVGSRSLAWVLFHRPWNYVTSWLTW